MLTIYVDTVTKSASLQDDNGHILLETGEYGSIRAALEPIVSYLELQEGLDFRPEIE